MAARRVAVVGLGTVNPLAATAASTWERLCLGHSGIRAINDLDNYIQLGIPARVAGEVQSIADSQYGLNDSLYSSVLPKRKLPRGIHFGMIAAYQALEHAQLLTAVDGKLTQTTLQPSRVGVAIGTGISGVHELLDNHDALNTRGYRRVSPYLIPNSLVNMTAGLVSMQYNLQGPNHAVSTACSTGAHAIGDAFRLIKHGYTDAMVCGGTDACITPLVVAGFARAKALATQSNDHPHQASRPFDAARSGFVIGEGAAILVLELESMMLERGAITSGVTDVMDQEWESAVSRGQPILAELVGYGMSDGRGAIASMQQALDEAGVTGNDVDYVNAHATSTPVGDEIEALAIAHATHDGVMVSATKSSTGHLLGAAGALEAMLTIQALQAQAVPPILNLESPIETRLQLPTTTTPHRMRIALSNSFGFGGTNASLCFKSCAD